MVPRGEGPKMVPRDVSDLFSRYHELAVPFWNLQMLHHNCRTSNGLVQNSVELADNRVRIARNRVELMGNIGSIA